MSGSRVVRLQELDNAAYRVGARQLRQVRLESERAGAVGLDGFVEKRPMSEINPVFTALHAHELSRRPVLIPDFG